MGPLRGGLILSLLPGLARASACDTERPGWDGVPMTALGEALLLFSSPAALVLLAATILVIWLRHQWGALAVCLLWTALVSVVAFIGSSGETHAAAVTEGCVGSPTLFIAAVAAICVAMIFYTAPRPSRG